MARKRILTAAQKAAKAARAKRRRQARGGGKTVVHGKVVSNKSVHKQLDKYGRTPAQQKAFKKAVKKSNSAVKKAGVVSAQMKRKHPRKQGESVSAYGHRIADLTRAKTGERDEFGHKSPLSKSRRKPSRDGHRGQVRRAKAGTTVKKQRRRRKK